MQVSFTVYGRPQQTGSKSPWVPRRKDGSLVTRPDGRPVIATMDSNKKSKPWMAHVGATAHDVYGGELLDGPLRLTAQFFFARPKSHYGTGRNANRLKPSAPIHHAQTPDLAKLVRAIEDAMSGVVYRDDRQICQYGETSRQWTEKAERVEITIETLGFTDNDELRYPVESTKTLL